MGTFTAVLAAYVTGRFLYGLLGAVMRRAKHAYMNQILGATFWNPNAHSNYKADWRELLFGINWDKA